jgi:hypothetical protein
MRLTATVWMGVVGLVTAAGSALAGRGTFEHYVVTGLIVTGGVLLPVAAALMHRIGGRRGLKFTRALLLASVICITQVAALALGWVVHQRDVLAARRFCDQAIARLDEIRRIRGSYPTTLDEAIGASVAKPYLFLRSGQFVSSGDAFVLSFDEADAVIPHVRHYSSDGRGWTRF